MTTYAEHTVTCAACGADNRLPLLTSASAFGPCDLDLRPPEPMRSILGASVQYCASCTRYALRLDDPEEMRNAPRLQPIDYSLDGFLEAPTAYVFRRRAERAADAGDLPTAIHHFLCAAWLYDDHDAARRASLSRERAADALQALHATGATFNDERTTDLLLLADLYRRSGQFAQATACSETVLAEGEETLRRIARYEVELIQRGDTACHDAAEARVD